MARIRWHAVIGRKQRSPVGDGGAASLLHANIERANFAAPVHDPDIDQAELAFRITRFEQRRRREIALEAMPEPESQEALDLGCLLDVVGM